MRVREAACGKFRVNLEWKRISAKPEWANAEVVSNITNTHAAEAERERRLSQPVFEAMRDAGLYRM